MEIRPEDAKTVLLAEDDFGHELRVGDVYRKAKLGQFSTGISKGKIEHGGTYTDPSLGKPRQFDYRFTLCHRGGMGYKVDKLVLLAVECKNLHPTSPLFVCGVPRSQNETFYNFIVSRRRESRSASFVQQVETSRERDLYQYSKFVGKSLVRLKTGGKPIKQEPQPDLYERWSQAVQSATDLVESASTMAESEGVEYVASLILPVVVVPDGLLWKCEYAVDGSIPQNPSKIDECEFFIGRVVEPGPKNMQTGPLKLSHVHFVTLTGFARLLNIFLHDEWPWEGFFTA